jgi:putative FmdB family regulatory protein
MPTYEYECKKCLSRFEVKRGFDEKGSYACPKCGGEGRHIILPTPIIFKGSGFYITDSRKRVDQSAEEGQPVKPSSEKPATETVPAKAVPASDQAKPSTKPEVEKPATKPEPNK